MCGIFGEITSAKRKNSITDFTRLAHQSCRRGTDASGLFLVSEEETWSLSDTCDVKELLTRRLTTQCSKAHVRFGFSRMITNSETESQPVRVGDIYVMHNGIVTNFREIQESESFPKNSELDSMVIAQLIDKALKDGLEIENIAAYVLSKCVGQVAAVCFLTKQSKILFFSNNGSLFIGRKDEKRFVASEEMFLKRISCVDISKVTEGIVLDCHFSLADVKEKKRTHGQSSFVKNYFISDGKYKLTEFTVPELVRCRKCILPETMPFISFDEKGECNYCKNYITKIPKDDLTMELRNTLKLSQIQSNKVLVPISGGRDSCFTLSFVKETLGLDAIAFTYDWGFVTDLARRNISRMCGSLGIEHILVAKDLTRKRRNVQLNVEAWLAKPDLGMLSILTAGDKHFFKYADVISKETGCASQFWGTNSLEETHFKSGFLGVEPKLNNRNVYAKGILSQFDYHSRRLARFITNPRYLNVSLPDTYVGEYYRSIVKRTNYYHLFDYIKWDENRIEKKLESYGWEFSPETGHSWRIGDATAPFYNYAYLRIAGFTECDTFRSNQIREGLITREEALKLIIEENMPRPASIKWYLDTVGVDFESAIKRINATPTLYSRIG